ncbi:uncharacterized protein FTOL_06803 [Fusarium torulosum]|uniref:Uncharacterized protein n=1 Tax=Fusarium torulosum TaxID=33205 RepID=A0AAE8SIF0_9HYPO|nr:uncharacterized protein FTOL_06803 [Fusarium torulosum]
MARWKMLYHNGSPVIHVFDKSMVPTIYYCPTAATLLSSGRIGSMKRNSMFKATVVRYVALGSSKRSWGPVNAKGTTERFKESTSFTTRVFKRRAKDPREQLLSISILTASETSKSAPQHETSNSRYNNVFILNPVHL